MCLTAVPSTRDVNNIFAMVVVKAKVFPSLYWLTSECAQCLVEISSGAVQAFALNLPNGDDTKLLENYRLLVKGIVYALEGKRKWRLLHDVWMGSDLCTAVVWNEARLKS